MIKNKPKKPENMDISEMALEVLGVARILLGRCLSLIGDQYTDEVILRQDIKKFLRDTKLEE